MELLLIFDCLVLEISFSDSLFAESDRFEPVEIDLADVRTDRFIGDKYERLAFEKVMRNLGKKGCMQIRLSIQVRMTI